MEEIDELKNKIPKIEDKEYLKRAELMELEISKVNLQERVIHQSNT